MFKRLKSKPKSTQFIIAGYLALGLACLRWFLIPEEAMHDTFITLAALGIIGHGYSLREKDKKINKPLLLFPRIRGN
ncbi:hypothetical protein [Proteus mirabilis]|uniref:hypothetical protein n=1 Tax=Proteus mirabilis TaxID=584 RepID=UPI0034D545C4